MLAKALEMSVRQVVILIDNPPLIKQLYTVNVNCKHCDIYSEPMTAL